MKLFIITLIIVAFCIFAMCFNIIFRKNGTFPDSEIEHNKALRKQGIQCAKVEERIIWRKKNKSQSCAPDGCSSCSADCTK